MTDKHHIWIIVYIALIAAFCLGLVLGYQVGHADGKHEAVRAESADASPRTKYDLRLEF